MILAVILEQFISFIYIYKLFYWISVFIHIVIQILKIPGADSYNICVLIFRNIAPHIMKDSVYLGCVIPLVLLLGFNLTSFLGTEKFLKRERSRKEANNINTSDEIYQVVYLTTFQMLTGAAFQFFLGSLQVKM